MENDILIANACDEYYLYKREDGTYYVKYSPDFYEKHAKLLPQFNIFSDQHPIEELSEKEFMEFLENTVGYYGEDCLIDKSYKDFLK
ncbi:MAG: hypothetical protein IJS60_04590 [Abditibacteriota bacterium]|nr:hypothetical protein [Abditibacteriota bacterium]